MHRFLVLNAALLTWLSSITILPAQDHRTIAPQQQARLIAFGQADLVAAGHPEPSALTEPDQATSPDAHGHHDTTFALDDSHHSDSHHVFDHFAPFHHRHETKDGYPILEVLKTDHAFLERKVRVDYVAAKGVDDGRTNESQFNGEFFWAINNRIAVVVESPLILRDPADASSTCGVGDTEFGFRFVAFDGETSILTFGLNIATPTGDDKRGLGEGHTSLEPVALLWHDLGCGNAFQGELALESPVGVPEAETVFRYNFALSHTLRSTEHLCFFHWLTPFLELDSRTHLNGDSSGRTHVDITPGLRWAINEGCHAAVGFSVPITGAREYDNQFIASWCHHF